MKGRDLCWVCPVFFTRFLTFFDFTLVDVGINLNDDVFPSMERLQAVYDAD